MNIKKVVTGIFASALMACSLSAFTATADDFVMTYKKGDVSGDGQITEKDSNLLLSYIVGNTTLGKHGKKAADVNWDNTIDIADVICINKYVAGDEYAIHTGDLDHDNVASTDDVDILKRYLRGTKKIDWKDADYDGDNDCDIDDYSLLIKYVYSN
jgi:hypothetical protein